MMRSNSAQQSWEPASSLGLEDADNEGLWGEMGGTVAGEGGSSQGDKLLRQGEIQHHKIHKEQSLMNSSVERT